MTCEHVNALTDQHGELKMGSYHIEDRNGRRVIVCKECGKFYGYLEDGPWPEKRRPANST